MNVEIVLVFMENTAIDIKKQDALNSARMQPTGANDFNVPKNGSANNYLQDSGGMDHLQNGRANNYLQNGSADNSSDKSDQNNHVDRLAESRRKSNISDAHKEKNAIGDAIEASTPMGAFSLLKQINPLTDMPYIAAIGAALAKDLITLATFETVILPVVLSALCTIFVFMMLALVGANGKRKAANAIYKKLLILVAFGILGTIPGLDIFPEETAGVIIVYLMTLSERKHAEDAPNNSQ